MKDIQRMGYTRYSGSGLMDNLGSTLSSSAVHGTGEFLRIRRGAS
jgi:hypothetical protein